MLPAWVVKINEIINPTRHTKVAARFLLILNFSVRDDAIGSTRAIAEVKPAKRILKKNKGAIMYAASPIWLNTCGKTTNASPVPSVTKSLNGIPVVKVMNPRMENTPNALNTSKPELVNATSRALSANANPSGR